VNAHAEAAAAEPRPEVLVLGIGNVLWADEGFGVRAVEALHRRWSLPANVSVVDGGTQGVYLLDHVCSAERVLVLDAIDFALAPGTLRSFRDAEVPEGSGRAMSLHQATFQELLSLARVRGRYPERITLIGVQPAVLDDLGGSLSPLVRARLDEAVELAVAELRAWGIDPMPRAEPPAEPLAAGALAIDAYEAGRPSAIEACRIGDARFLNQAPGAEPG
jgi:hydrogenase maturation protease